MPLKKNLRASAGRRRAMPVDPDAALGLALAQAASAPEATAHRAPARHRPPW